MQADKNVDKTESLRLFYALWPDEATRAALAQLQTMTQGRMTRYDNLHLTLAFLGKQPVTLLPVLENILAQLPKPDIKLVLNRIGYFKRSHIAWVGIHEVPDALSALRSALAQQLEQYEIVFDNRSLFKPHITLARDATIPADIAFTPIEWTVSHVALVESVTRQDGVTYRVLASR